MLIPLPLSLALPSFDFTADELRRTPLLDLEDTDELGLRESVLTKLKLIENAKLLARGTEIKLRSLLERRNSHSAAWYTQNKGLVKVFRTNFCSTRRTYST